MTHESEARRAIAQATLDAALASLIPEGAKVEYFYTTDTPHRPSSGPLISNRRPEGWAPIDSLTAAEEVALSEERGAWGQEDLVTVTWGIRIVPPPKSATGGLVKIRKYMKLGKPSIKPDVPAVETAAEGELHIAKVNLGYHTNFDGERVPYKWFGSCICGWRCASWSFDRSFSAAYDPAWAAEGNPTEGGALAMALEHVGLAPALSQP